MANQSDGIEQCVGRMREGLAEGDAAKVQKFMEKAKRMGAPAERLAEVVRSYGNAQKKCNYE